MEDFKDQIKENKAQADALTFTVDKLYQKLGDLNKQQTALAESGKTNIKYYETVSNLLDKYSIKLDTYRDSLTATNVKLFDQERVLVSSRERIEVWGKAWDGAKGKVENISDKTDKLGKILGGAAQGFNPFTENLQNAVKVITPFKDAISKANAAYTDYQQNVASGKGKFESFKGAMSGLTKGFGEGVGGLKNLKIAFAETGIGLVIIAVAALIEKLKSMKPVMDLINAVTASIGAVMGTLANNIIGLFTHPIDTIKNFGSSMVGAAKDAYQLSLAQEKLKTALSGQEVANEKIKNQVDLLKQQAENTKLSTDVRRAKLQEAYTLDEKYFKQNGDLANKAMDNAVKAAKIKGTLHDEEVANLRSKGTEYARMLLDTGRIDQEQFDDIKKAELDLIKMRKEHADNFKAFLDSRQKLTDEDQAKADEKKSEKEQQAKELAKKQIAEKRARLDKEREFNAEAKKERIESIARLTEATLNGFEKEVFATNNHFDELKKRYAKNKATLEQIERERVASLLSISKKFQETDLEKLASYEQTLNQIRIDATEDVQQRAVLQAENDKAAKLSAFDKGQDELKKRLEAEEQQLQRISSIASANELEALKNSINKQNKVYKEAADLRGSLATQLEKKVAEAKKGNTDTPKTVEPEKPTGDLSVDQQFELLKQQRINAIIEANNNRQIKNTLDRENKIKRIEEDYAKKRADLEDKLATSKIHAGDKYIDAVLKNTKKDSAIYKAAFMAKKATSIADTIISTKRSVMESLKAYSGIPFIGQALGITQAAFMAAQGAMSIAEIAKQKPGFASGGQYVSDGRGALLPGYSSADDTNAYLRSGEAVVVSEAMRNPWARNLVSAINVAHGGRDFSMPNTGRGYAIGGIFTDGGNANRYYNQPVNDIKEMANTVAYQMINNFPPIYVDVKDVNNQQNILAQTVNRVNL